jgi:cytochrome P450
MNFVKIIENIIYERRMAIKNGQIGENNNLLGIILETNDERGEKLDDKDIID